MCHEDRPIFVGSVLGHNNLTAVILCASLAVSVQMKYSVMLILEEKS